MKATFYKNDQKVNEKKGLFSMIFIFFNLINKPILTFTFYFVYLHFSYGTFFHIIFRSVSEKSVFLQLTEFFSHISHASYESQICTFLFCWLSETFHEEKCQFTNFFLKIVPFRNSLIPFSLIQLYLQFDCICIIISE